MTTTIEKAQVELPNDHQVKVTRRFAAPRELVFKAYTTPSLMQRWLTGMPGWTMPVCEMDLRVDGEYRWRWRNEQGNEFGFFGTFSEVTPPARISHTQYYDPGDIGGDMGNGATITVEFVDDEHGTTMTTLMDFGSMEARDAALSTGMTDGMEISYRQLDEMLAEQVEG